MGCNYFYIHVQVLHPIFCQVLEKQKRAMTVTARPQSTMEKYEKTSISADI